VYEENVSVVDAVTVKVVDLGRCRYEEQKLAAVFASGPLNKK